MEKIEVIENGIKNNKSCEEIGVNWVFLQAYNDSMEKETKNLNFFRTFGDSREEKKENSEEIVENLKKFKIKEFTISKNGVNHYILINELIKNGFKLEGESEIDIKTMDLEEFFKTLQFKEVIEKEKVLKFSI